MPCSPEAACATAPRRAVAGPAALVDALAPLLDEWRRRGALVRAHRLAAGEDLAVLLERLFVGDADAADRVGERPLLMILEEPTRPSLRARLALTSCGRTPVPLPGWLRMDAAALGAYAARAVAILQRAGTAPAPVVLLGPREARYRTALDEVAAGAAGIRTLRLLRWSAERIRKPPLLDALRLGAAAAIYMGHGHRRGWLAYGGLCADDFLVPARPWKADEATALFFALSCGSAAPDGIADALVAAGMAGAVLAPVGDPLHADNKRLGRALVDALADGHLALPSLLEAVRAPMDALRTAGYMVIGDPGLAAVAARGALARGVSVFAPSPDAALVPAATDS